MSNILTKTGKSYALKYTISQLVIILINCSVFYKFSGIPALVSALCAGCVAVIPSIIFALKAFQYAGATASKRVVESFNKGVKLKMLLTAILFALSFKYINIEPKAFFTTYSLTLVAPWLTAFVNKFYFNQQ